MPAIAPARARLRTAAAAALCIWASLALASTAARGHDGPLGGAASRVEPRPGGLFRLAAHSDAYELVAVVDGGALTLYLDRFETNEPVSDARIEIIAGAGRAVAEARPDGSYRATLPALIRPGQHELVFSIIHSGGDDLLAAVLDRRQPGDAAGTPSSVRASAGAQARSIAGLLLALAAGLIIGLTLRRPPPRRST